MSKLNSVLIIILILLIYILFYFTSFGIADENFVVWDGIVIIMCLIAVTLDLKHHMILCLLGLTFVMLSPVDLTEGISGNKILIMLHIYKRYFNYNRIFPITLFVGGVFMSLFTFDIVIKIYKKFAAKSKQ